MFVFLGQLWIDMFRKNALGIHEPWILMFVLNQLEKNIDFRTVLQQHPSQKNFSLYSVHLQ